MCIIWVAASIRVRYHKWHIGTNVPIDQAHASLWDGVGTILDLMASICVKARDNLAFRRPNTGIVGIVKFVANVALCVNLHMCMAFKVRKERHEPWANYAHYLWEHWSWVGLVDPTYRRVRDYANKRTAPQKHNFNYIARNNKPLTMWSPFLAGWIPMLWRCMSRN